MLLPFLLYKKYNKEGISTVSEIRTELFTVL